MGRGKSKSMMRKRARKEDSMPFSIRWRLLSIQQAVAYLSSSVPWLPSRHHHHRRASLITADLISILDSLPDSYSKNPCVHIPEGSHGRHLINATFSVNISLLWTLGDRKPRAYRNVREYRNVTHYRMVEDYSNPGVAEPISYGDLGEKYQCLTTWHILKRKMPLGGGGGA